jgi:tripartite-type tricarboxylate transporter receptor subunit TctC
VTFLRSLSIALVVAGSAHAQQYPAQPIRMIVPFPVGGGADIAARVVAMHLATTLGQGVVVENYGGAGGTIGTAKAAQAPADGYTIFVGTPSTHGTNVAVLANLPYDPIRDFSPIGLIGTSPFLLIVHPSVPASSAKELIALAKSKPGELTYASFGNGSINHLGAELFNSMANIDVRHIPYRGGAPALADLIGGRTTYTFDGTAALPAIRAGPVKLLAVGSAERWHVFPDVPTIAESALPGFDLSTWYGLFAPAKTPADVIDRLNKSAALAVQSEAFKRLGVNEGLVMVARPPDELDRYVRGEEERWRKVIQDAAIKIE